MKLDKNDYKILHEIYKDYEETIKTLRKLKVKEETIVGYRNKLSLIENIIVESVVEC